MTRGEVWIAEVGGKQRPVLVMTRTEVIDVRVLVTVAEITTTIRGLASEVILDHVALGLQTASTVNCDGLHTVRQASLSRHVGSLDHVTLEQVCAAVSYALGC